MVFPFCSYFPCLLQIHKIEVSYQEAVALKRQEELIREEEAAWLVESEQKAKRGATEKEKKLKKKQAKQKRNNRKVKDKGREDGSGVAVVDKHQESNLSDEKKELDVEEVQPVLEKAEVLEDVSDVSDSDGVAEVLQPDSEDRDASPVNWDTDTLEVHPPTEAGSSGVSGLSSVPNGTTEKRAHVRWMIFPQHALQIQSLQ